MEKIKLVYTSLENCDSPYSIDTTIEEDYNSVNEALKNCNLNEYDAHNCTDYKEVSLQIIKNNKVKEYTLATQSWDYQKQEWGEIEIKEFDINYPDKKFEL